VGTIAQAVARALLLLGDGPAAVTTFFIVSGVVLAWSMQRAGPIGSMYGHLLWQRLVRIFPAHIVVVSAVMITILAFGLPMRSALASAWQEWWYARVPTVGEYARNLLLFSASLNSVTWSLFHEVYAALALPLLVLLVARVGLIGSLVLIPIVFALGPLAALLWPFPWGKNPFEYLFTFLTGVIIALNAARLDCGRWAGPVGIACLALMPVARLFFTSQQALMVWEASLGAGVVVACLSTTDHALKRLLRTPLMQEFGRMCLSFYLAHFPILFLLVSLAAPMLSPQLVGQYPVPVLLGSAALSIAAAWAVCRVLLYPVERRFMRLKPARLREVLTGKPA
jgi:peptidoglycan/LPS O-acetylase OafA/YrhL